MKPIDSKSDTQRVLVKRLIWVYFWLLILEGPLRKWIFPGLADPLLVVRDPVVVAIYGLALSAGLFRLNAFVVSAGVLCVASVGTTLLIGETPLGVVAYGFRSSFLHLPLIFIIPRVFRREDVLKLGLYCLYLLLPMAVLMVLQFQADPDHFWNYGPGATPGAQMEGALGKIRAPGYFSFITGAAQFIALCTAFVLFGFVQKRTYPLWLVAVSAAAIVLSAGVSISRLTVGSVLVVGGVLALMQLLNPAREVGRVLRVAIPIAVVFIDVIQLPAFKEGAVAFESRFERTGDAGESAIGVLLNWANRTWVDTTGGLRVVANAALLGEGLGKGTNVGARYLTGELQFMLAEGEWARVILEMGPPLGLAFILWRLILVVSLFRYARDALKVGNQLPLLLWGACALLVITGQWGQSTTHGFTMLIAGLTMAACRFEIRAPSRRNANAAEAFPAGD